MIDLIEWRISFYRKPYPALYVWLWGGRGIKVKRVANRSFSERYQKGCRVWQLPKGWCLVWKRP